MFTSGWPVVERHHRNRASKAMHPGRGSGRSCRDPLVPERRGPRHNKKNKKILASAGTGCIVVDMAMNYICKNIKKTRHKAWLVLGIVGWLLGAGVGLRVEGIVLMTEPEELLSWDAEGITGYGPSPWSATQINPVGVELVAGLERGFGLDTGGSPPENVWGGRGFTSDNLQEALAEGQFVTFSVMAEEGSWLHISELRQNFRRSGTGPSQFLWQFQVGDAPFASIGSPWEYTGTHTQGQAQPAISLAGIPELQEVTEVVTFRLVGWDGGSVGSWGFGRVAGPDLVVLGNVAVIPEPRFASALFALTLLGWVLWRRHVRAGHSSMHGGTADDFR